MAEIAIITRTKDRPLLLRRAMSSILSQTFKDFCWVVVNDGGAPTPVNSLLAEAEAAGIQVQVLHHPYSKGMEAASNAGIDASTSRYLVVHDDDDSWEPAFLQRTVDALKNRPHPLVRGVVTYCTEVRERIEGESVIELGRRSYNGDLGNIRLNHYLTENRTPPICFVYERQVHEEIGPYAADMAVLGDWEFFLRYYQRYEAVLVREHLANYHIRPANSPTTYGNSVTAGVDKHAFFAQLMWNRLLREDLAAGRFGVGALSAMTQAIHTTSRRLDLPLALIFSLQEARRDGVDEIVVCGAGEAGRKALQFAKAMGLKVRCMTDKGTALHGTLFEGVPIVSLEQGVRTGLPCFIASLQFADEIAAEIRQLAGEMGGGGVPQLYRPSALV